MEAKGLGDRPINIIAKRLEEIQNEKEVLSNFSKKQYEIEEERQKLVIQIKEQENEIEFLKELRNLHEKQDLEKQKVVINENMVKEYKKKIDKLQESISDDKVKKEDSKLLESKKNELSDIKYNQLIENEYNKNNKSTKKNKDSKNIKSENNKNSKNEGFKNEDLKNQNKKILTTTLNIIFLIMMIISIFSIKNYYITTVTIIMFILTIIYSYTQFKNKTGKTNNKKQENVENDEQKTTQSIEQNLEKKKEIEVLEKSIEKLKEEVINTNQKLEQELKFQTEKLRNKYIGRISIRTIDEKIEKQTVVYDINILQNRISENKIKLHSIELDKSNILPKLENLANLEEEYEDLQEKHEQLCKKHEQIELVKQEIEKAYETMKKTITPKFTNNLSKIIEKVSDGRYKNIQLDETNGMIVEIENGNYISAKNLSVGTIDELYLSLRLGAGLEISNETLPIILDEAFAYWDNTRLQNILIYLKEEFKDRQIILFTCTNRESQILDKTRN